MYFGTTYTLLAVSPLALALLVRRGDASQRLVGLFYASAVAVLAYAGLVGTLEEQALYLMLVPALGALGAAASLLTGRQALRLSLFSLLLMVNLATYLQWRLRPDDGFVQLRHYMAAHVPAGSAVITSGDVKENLGGSFRVLAGRYRIVRWVSRQDAVSQNARYLIVPWKDVSDGYSYLSVSRVRSLTNKAVALFSFHGRTYTNLVLYRLPLPARPHAGGRG
jgi:hypothetical protein